jgi:hypothetical protein
MIYFDQKGSKDMKAIMTREADSVLVNEEFISFDTRPLDSKHRITLGGKLMLAVSQRVRKVDSYQVLVGKGGDILLRPAVSIPASEAWIYENPKVIGRIRKGLDEAKQGKKEAVHNLDAFLDKL